MKAKLQKKTRPRYLDTFLRVLQQKHGVLLER